MSIFTGVCVLKSTVVFIPHNQSPTFFIEHDFFWTLICYVGQFQARPIITRPK